MVMGAVRKAIWANRVSRSQYFPVVFVVGPTASGKSDVAIAAARQFQGVILNADSIQNYQGVNIGAAKPSPIQLKLVPHLLMDWVPLGQDLTAADYRRRALELLKQWALRGPVFVVGGSGFYIKALEKGLYPVAKIPPQIVTDWRNRLEQEGAPQLYQELEKCDPEYALKIKSADGYRITRALMLMAHEQKTMTQIIAEHNQRHVDWPFSTFKIGLQVRRELLRQRVKARVEKMLVQGWEAEVRDLLAKGYKNWAPLRSVGYKEMVELIEGQLPKEQFVERVVQSTMTLAKKQMTWFRADKSIQWFDIEAGVNEILTALSRTLAIDSRSHPSE